MITRFHDTKVKYFDGRFRIRLTSIFQILLPLFLFIGSNFYYLAYHGITFRLLPVINTAQSASHAVIHSRTSSLEDEIITNSATQNATNESQEQKENYQNGCSIHRHVAFLKTHKTGR